jgi:hypothetical protein
MPPAGSGVLPLPDRPPADVYRLRAAVSRGDGDGDGAVLATGEAPGLLIVQGARFREPELTFTADVASRDIWMTTVTATTIRAQLVLRGAGDDLVISDGTIASDLAPVGRVVTFTGRTVDDRPVPAGDYQAVLVMHARADTVTYEQAGLVIHWQP